MVYDGETVRTPFGALAKSLFGPESHKKQDTEPGEDSVSWEACLKGPWFEPEASLFLERIYLFADRHKRLFVRLGHL